MSTIEDKPVVFKNQAEFERAVMDVIRKKLSLAGSLDSHSLDLMLTENDFPDNYTKAFFNTSIQNETDIL